MTTKTKPAHAGEPWRHRRLVLADEVWSDADEREPVYVARLADGANAARIVACVNACAGIRHPAALAAIIERARDEARGRCTCDEPEGDEVGTIVCERCEWLALVRKLDGKG